MSVKSELSRITIDLPKADHKKLKSMAALQGISMRELVLEAIKSIEECVHSSHIPNKKTLKAIKDAEQDKGLVKGKYAEKLAKKLGI